METRRRSADRGAARDVGRRIASQLAKLRAERGWPLERLAEQTGISRPTLSRIERGELSPTASMLGTLCGVYGWTLSRLMAEAEVRPPHLVRASDQSAWKDPASGYVRRAVSPPGPGLRGEMVEVRMPRGATVGFDTAPVAGLEHHLWLLEGALTLHVDGSAHALRPGDCLRYVLTGPTRFESTGRTDARYVIAMVHP